jgi:adenylosuccinate lyase
MLSGTTEKIGREVYALMRTEYQEVEEPLPSGKVGSSTMPQKRNPHICQDIIARSASARAAVPMALEAISVEHEADRSKDLLMQEATQTACIAMGDVLVRIVYVAEQMVAKPDHMARNLKLTRGLIMAEAVMMRLGSALGRQRAHDLVYRATQDAAAGRGTFRQLLVNDPAIRAELNDETIDALLDPSNYLGFAPQIARDAARRARQAVATLRTD